MTIQEKFNAIINYNTNKVLDIDFKTYSKAKLFFLYIVSVIFGCFGAKFPDCEMGNVAKKVNTFVSQNRGFLIKKSVDDLNNLENQIHKLKTKAVKKDNAAAVTPLANAAAIVGCLRDQQFIKTSNDHLQKYPDILTSLNGLPPVQTVVNTTQIEFGADYNRENADIYYSRNLTCTYQFGENGTELVVEGGVQKELTTQIKQLFNRKDKAVTEDPLLKTIFKYLGPTGCIDLDGASNDDLALMSQKHLMPGGRKLANVITPLHFTFIPSPDNPNQATIQTESDCVLRQGDQDLYFKLCNTIVITQDPNHSDQCSVSIQRRFEPLK